MPYTIQPELRGVDLLDAIIEQIEREPHTWDQGVWHSSCGTQHCVAGWAEVITGNYDNTYVNLDINLNLESDLLKISPENGRYLFWTHRTLDEIKQFAVILRAGFTDGRDIEGYDYDGYDKRGFSRQGHDKYGYDEEGYSTTGYNDDGYDRNGYDEDGYDIDGYDNDGYDIDGYDRNGYDEDGYDSLNFDRDGYHRLDSNLK
jgi:hypothetical protein